MAQWGGNTTAHLPPFQNTYKCSVVAQRSLKISTSQVQASLREVGVKEVWLRQFGTKTPTMIFKLDFDYCLTSPFRWPMAFDLGWAQALDGVCLLGLDSGGGRGPTSIQCSQACLRLQTKLSGAPWRLRLLGTEEVSRAN